LAALSDSRDDDKDCAGRSRGALSELQQIWTFDVDSGGFGRVFRIIIRVFDPTLK